MALTTPAVTVLLSPKGLPMATTVSPIIRSELVPSFAAGRGSLELTLSTATSLLASLPMTSASKERPSASTTWMAEAPRMTWSLVMMMPLASTSTPLPRLCECSAWGGGAPKKSSIMERRRPRKGDSASCSVPMKTTAGETFCTTSTTSLRRRAMSACAGSPHVQSTTARNQGLHLFIRCVFTCCPPSGECRELLSRTGIPEEPAGRSRPSRTGMRPMSLVLVADDEPAVREVLSQVIEDLGHDVIQARDGEEAWEMARARRPHLVVTDHMMPRLSGLDLCRRLRSDEVLGSVPTILLSAVLPLGAPEAHSFLHKPFEITDFEGLVHKSLAETPRPKPLEGPTVLGAQLGNWAAQGFGGPLATARAEVERLRASGPVGAESLEALDTRLRSLEVLTRDFQEAALLAARSFVLKREPVELGARLREAVDAWTPRRPEVRWSLEVPPAPVEVRSDATRLARMLDALLSHAGRQGGAVHVSLALTTERVMIEVKDSLPEPPRGGAAPVARALRGARGRGAARVVHRLGGGPAAWWGPLGGGPRPGGHGLPGHPPRS